MSYEFDEERVPDTYLLVHSHQAGDTHSVIYYYPSEDAPYPDLRKVAGIALGSIYEPHKGECIQLIPIEPEPDLELEPEDAGTRVFTEFWEGPLDG